MLQRIFLASAVALSFAIFLLASVPAEAQTKHMFEVLATSIPKAVLPLGELEKSVGTVSWGLIIPHLSGQIRTNAELAKQAQEDFVRALRQYRTTLEDVSYLGQLCAR